jgi:hypothetical protein
VVHWDVEVSNQDGDPVAVYTILTLVRQKRGAHLPSSPTLLAAAMAGEAPAAVRPPEMMEKTQPGDAPARVS